MTYRTRLMQMWRRLWAMLALACVLSLVNGAVAGAAEVGLDLQSIASSVAADNTQVSSHQEDGGKKSPSKSHCALCCTHTGVSVLPTIASAATPAAAAAVHEVQPDRFALFPRGEGPDQPPRA